MPSLAAFGANLAVVALSAAKAAGDALIVQVADHLEAQMPALTDRALVDFLDVIPPAYRAEVHLLFDPVALAASKAIDTALADRIHTGCAIAQAVLDSRITALQAKLV
jgi:hypothetical protein